MQPDEGESGYLRDVAYVRQFSKQLAPLALRAAAALNGFAPPPAEDFDYCELGCGTGDTVSTLAAAYPRGRFVGVDFNPEHVAFARALAERGGLANVRFLERDFAHLSREALPAFDYVCAHGVLSWVAPATR
ncbi:MAG TPA: class I SAM-dependent methyltransferase, partial [Polyangiaceae bacterium]|nr:class I SAM-dependent methyltransferase [Polyangiaceae bacterium]